jgi:hypothetical protein
MKAKVTFHKLIQNTQDLVASDPNQNHMVSRAFFTLDVRGKQYADMSVTLRQPFGTDYAKKPIEVEKPWVPMAATGITTISETPSKIIIVVPSAVEVAESDSVPVAKTFARETIRSFFPKPTRWIFRSERAVI